MLTPHEEPDCFTVSTVLRNLPQVEEFVVEWDYPLMRLAPDLNPGALRRPQSKNKVCSDKEFVEAVMTAEGKSFTNIVSEAKATLKMSPRTRQPSTTVRWFSISSGSGTRIVLIRDRLN